MLMKRMILLLTVAAFMAATLAVNAGPAWAQNSDEDTWCEKIKPAPEEKTRPSDGTAMAQGANPHLSLISLTTR